MKRIETDIIISSKVEDVWKAIMDVSSYHKWNPQIVNINGEIELNGNINVEVYSPDNSGLQYSFDAKLVDFKLNKILAWEGGTEGILYGYHYWVLEDLGDTTRLVHGEDMRGTYIDSITLDEFNLLKPAYEKFNRNLKQYIEGFKREE